MQRSGFLLILGWFVFAPPAPAVEPPPGVQAELLRCVGEIEDLNSPTRDCKGLSAPDPSWASIPELEAQCTPGAKSAAHAAQVRVSVFPKESRLRLEVLSSPSPTAVRDAMKRDPRARFVGNGPIYLAGTSKPNGYVKSEGKVLNPLDCVNYRSDSQNLGRENSVFLRYRPRTSAGAVATAGPWKYRVVSTEFLCRQLQPKAFVEELRKGLSPGGDGEEELKKLKKWEPEEDLVTGDQIDFAIQSGPAVLRREPPDREPRNLLSGYNQAKSYRSYVGVDSNGDPVVVEAEGNIGAYCLGEYLRSRGIRELLHRDSVVSDAQWREKDGSVKGYPHPNPQAEAANLLIFLD